MSYIIVCNIIFQALFSNFFNYFYFCDLDHSFVCEDI
nr:MAG TPA: hypothetical protein [Caudoviricetes sp.]